jgi:hypothetical protein
VYRSVLPQIDGHHPLPVYLAGRHSGSTYDRLHLFCSTLACPSERRSSQAGMEENIVKRGIPLFGSILVNHRVSAAYCANARGCVDAAFFASCSFATFPSSVRVKRSRSTGAFLARLKHCCRSFFLVFFSCAAKGGGGREGGQLLLCADTGAFSRETEMTINPKKTNSVCTREGEGRRKKTEIKKP